MVLSTINFHFNQVVPDDFNSFVKMNVKNPKKKFEGLGTNSRRSLYGGTNENREFIQTLKIDTS